MPENSFQKLQTLADVAAFLGVSHKQLRHVLYRIPEGRRYGRYQVPKKSGQPRDILAPIAQLKNIQQSLNFQLQAFFQAKPAVHGFVPGRSIVTNAQIHVGNRMLLNVDLKDFFPTINFGRVRGVFLKKPFECSPHVATILAQICCFDGKLPQGAPTSPMISNLICRRMDTDLQRLGREYKCLYSRYADDISFSTRRAELPPQIAYLNSEGTWVIGELLGGIIRRHQFIINTEKIFVRRRHERQIVTGLKINRVPNVSRKVLSRIRAMLHAWKKYGLRAAEKEFRLRYARRKHRPPFCGPASFPFALKGYIEFVGMVRGKDSPVFRRFARELREQDPSLTKNWDLDTLEERIEKALCIIECLTKKGRDVIASQGTGFGLTGFGTVTCAHALPALAEAYKPSSTDKKYPVTVILKSEELDVAVISVNIPTLLKLEPSFVDPRSGDTILIAGYPNYAPGASGTLVRARVIGHRAHFGTKRFLVDMPIVAGTSGGPVMDINGHVVGVAVQGVASAGQVRDQEFAFVPISALRTLLNAG